MNTQESV